MILLPPDSVAIDDYCKSFLNFELIGFWPCSGESEYFACSAAGCQVAPVFLGYNKEFWFDAERQGDKEKDHWILFFLGCDDGSSGLRFNTKELALKWIYECLEVDFAQILRGRDEFRRQKVVLNWYN